MNPLLEKSFRNERKFGDWVNHGLAYTLLGDTAEKVYNDFKESTISSDGLQFVGYRRLTPREEYDVIRRKTSSKRSIPTTYSVMYKFDLTYNGEKLRPRYIDIPYVDPLSQYMANGKLFSVVPVWSDTILSRTTTGIFIKVPRLKADIDAMSGTMTENGRPIVRQILYGPRLIGSKTIQTPSKAIYPPLAIVLAGYYGLDKLLEILGIDSKDVSIKFHYNVTDDDEYVFGSVGNKESKLRFIEDRHGVVITATKNVAGEKLNILRDLAAGFMYAFDLVPIMPKDIVKVISGTLKEEMMQWRRLTGVIGYLNTLTEGGCIMHVSDRLSELSIMVGRSEIREAKTIGLEIDGFFSLLAIIISKYREWTHPNNKDLTDISHQKFDVKSYFLSNASARSNSACRLIRKLESKDRMTKERVDKRLNTFLFSSILQVDISGQAKNIVIQPANDITNDQTLTRKAKRSELQSRSTGIAPNTNNVFPATENKASPMNVLQGTPFGQPKKAPTPKISNNYFSNIDIHSGIFKLTPEEKKLKKELGTLLSTLGTLPVGTEVTLNQDFIDEE